MVKPDEAESEDMAKIDPEKLAARVAKLRVTMAKKREAAKKTINTSTLAAKTPSVVYEEYYDWNDMQTKLFTNTTAERWAQEIVQYAKKPDVWRATEYFMENGIDYTEAMRLCAQYEVLDRAYSHARYLIGLKREKGGLKNELNSSIVHISQSMYDPEWKKNTEYLASLKKDNDKDKGNVTVLIERYPETNVVPVKVKDE